MLSCKNCEKKFEGKRGDFLCPECIESVHISNMLHFGNTTLLLSYSVKINEKAV